MVDDDDFGELYTDVLTSFTVENGVSNNQETHNLTQFSGFNYKLDGIKLDEPARVLETDDRNLGFDDPNLIDESRINVIENDVNDIDSDSDSDGDEFVVDAGIAESLIPGGDGGDSDDDSDGGLKIVLDSYVDKNDGGEGNVGGNVSNVVDEVAEGEQQLQRMEMGDLNRLRLPPPMGFEDYIKYIRPGADPLASGGPSGQVRPPLIIGHPPGRCSGDWCPSESINAPPRQTGYGMPVWTNNNSGNGLGRGLDFALPSHKTVFEVDINSFEEKPWRLPGVDTSDFFNFGLNEDSWKDYCKQLEQLRLEATMQSKIRVYESGRNEQNYDPDMPPELAAAVGIQVISADKTNPEKAEVGHTDIATGSMGVRPQLQTGRAIQVEIGYGERLPSIDARPHRIRDSEDAIIEIVLEDSADNDFGNRNNITELPEDTSREGLRGGHDIEDDNAQEENEFSDRPPEACNDRKRELAGRKNPFNKSVHRRVTGDGISRVMLESPPVQNLSSSVESPVYTGSLRDKRGRKGRIDRCPSITHSESSSDKRCLRSQKDESAKNIEVKGSPHFSAHRTRGVTEERCYEKEDSIHDGQPDGSFESDRVDVHLDVKDTHKDKYPSQSLKKQKIFICNEQSLEDVDERDGSKAARSSENSKAVSGSTSDYRNFPYGTEDEVVQHGMFTQMGIKKKLNEGDRRSRGNGREERQYMDRHHMVIKGREDPYYRKNWDSNRTHHSHLKAEVIDRRKDNDYSGRSWMHKDEESHGIRTRFGDPRKRIYSNDMGYRHRSKVREIERNDLDQYQLQKQSDIGSWRGSYHDKYIGSRQSDRDDILKSRSDNLDDLRGKRRKEDVDLKRDRGEKEDILRFHREKTSLPKRGRDDIMDRIKRDGIGRIRNVDQQFVRHKEDMWFPRERVDRQRNDWQRLKQSHEEALSKREREDVRGVKTGRTGVELSWASHSRAKDGLNGSDREYHLKDPGRHSEQHKRKDRVETKSLSRQRGGEDVYSWETRSNNDQRRSIQERPSARSERALNASEHQRMPEKKHKEYPRKIKESKEDHNSMVHPRRNQDDDYNSQISERVKIKSMIEQGSGDQVIPVSRQSSRKLKKDASSNDEQLEIMSGRSKSERWTSHKEMDFNAGTKSSSLNVKEIDDHKKVEIVVANTVPDESSNTVETGQNTGNGRDAGDRPNKDGEVKPKGDIDLDTESRLKERSEHFKLPMPSEKELGAVKMIAYEQFPPVQNESPADSEIKQERPARKRRWTGN